MRTEAASGAAGAGRGRLGGALAAVGGDVVELQLEPEPAHGPDRPPCLPGDGGGVPPGVGVVVHGPAVRAVQATCRLATPLPEQRDELLERLRRGRHVGGADEPVVHLQVDVRGEVRGPGGDQLAVPDPLQVGRRQAGPGGGVQEVPAVGDHRGQERGERCRLRGVPRGRLGLLRASGRVAEREAHPAGLGRAVCGVAGEEVGLAACERLCCGARRVVDDVSRRPIGSFAEAAP